MGVNSIMLNYTFDVIRNFGCKFVKISVLTDNYGAQNFYLTIGFKEFSRINEEVHYELELK